MSCARSRVRLLNPMPDYGDAESAWHLGEVGTLGVGTRERMRYHPS